MTEPDPTSFLTNPATGKQISPTTQPGYYPRYSTLGQKKFWDATTRALIEDRVTKIPAIQFFSDKELTLITDVAERIVPQDDRTPERRIPIVPRIDERLVSGRINGYRYEDMPPDTEAYRLGLRAIDETAQAIHAASFPELDVLKQEFILKSIHDGRKLAAHDIWDKMSIHRFWELLVGDCVTAYYAHPWAWDEIGFGGPAYPRAYMRLEGGQPEPWEENERRYEWKAPADSISDAFDEAASASAQSHHGQGNALKGPIGGAFEAAKNDVIHLGPLQRIPRPRQRFPENQTIDYCVVGVGSAGGVLCQRLAKAGFDVVGFEAGPFWDTEQDWVSDEAGSHKLYWNDLRITGGSDPLALGENNSGKGVGGGSVHWAAFTPRFHPSDFRVYTEDGLGADWPISYEDLKPYYELLEREMPVAGPAYFPWGDPHGYPYGPHPVGSVGDVLVRGCTKLGIRVCAGGPVGILSGSHGDRPHCIYRGFCIQGCKVGAKASTLVTHVPEALQYGAEIRDRSMVFRISVNKHNRVDGVHYYDEEGREHFQRAKAVIVCGYAIETPRLLLNSACPGHENGLANASGTLGRYLMAQAGNVVLGRFADLIRMYKAPPAHALTEEFYETDWRRGFARGFAIQTVGPLPISFAKQMMAAKGAWGWGMRRVMMDYNHWAALGVLGEILPWSDNRVELAKDKDQFGIPVAKVNFDLYDNDKKLIEFAKNTVMDVMRAAGAEEVVQESRYAHLVGGARMGKDPANSVVDGFCRAHDLANLFVCDGSVMPTQGSANPGLTIQALAARTADYLISQGTRIFTSELRDSNPGQIRKQLSPAGTFSKGVPRL